MLVDRSIQIVDVLFALLLAGVIYSGAMLHRVNGRFDLLAQGVDFANGRIERMDSTLNTLVEVHYNNRNCR